MAPSKAAMSRFLKGSRGGGKTKTRGKGAGRMVKPATKGTYRGLQIGNKGKGY